jgi:glycosyltransferase involved in cell wall biosynthesis
MPRILLAHNYYLQSGGEDTAFSSDISLLRAKGHEVFEYIEENTKIANMSALSLARDTFWSRSSYQRMRETIQEFRPDIVQFYNFFPLISPSAYYACRDEGVPVGQYLFNPRLICPAATLYRDGQLCTDCIGKNPPLPGFLHGCYHNSRLHTFVVGAMVSFHHTLKTWNRAVDFYLSATEFYRGLYIEGGLPAEKIMLKSNYISGAPPFSQSKTPGSYALFVARLDPEKGVKTLLRAWRTLDIPLKIRGNGQMESEMRACVRENSMRQVEFVKRLDTEAFVKLRQNARFLVWTSEGYYETFGLAAVECFAQGIPVIASDIGVSAEIVKDGETGLLFKAGDANDLAAKAKWLWEHPDEAVRMGCNARREYEEKYAPEKNYQQLLDIYDQVLNAQK